MLFGLVAWAFLPEFPDNNKFLSSEETKFVLERIEKDRGDSRPDEITIWKVFHHLADFKLWVYGMMFRTRWLLYELIVGQSGIMFMCATIPAYAIGQVLRALSD